MTELGLLITWLICLTLLVAFMWGACGRKGPRENPKRTLDEQLDHENQYYRKNGGKAKRAC